MRIAVGLVLSLILASAAAAQDRIPPGTLIPVSLSRSLNVRKLHSGQRFRAEIMQNIPGTPIKRRAQVVGHIVSLAPATSGHARLEIAFDAIQSHGQTIPIKTNLRALASFLEVQEAEDPEEIASRGITPEVATTTQIGGEQVYRGGGPVTEGDTVVGKPTPWGILGLPRTQPGMPCRGAVDHNDQSQAFWLFSTDACGIYGFSSLKIEHAGRTDPAGTVVLASNQDKLSLGSGTAMLLRVH